jgi:hypothetical protein
MVRRLSVSLEVTGMRNAQNHVTRFRTKTLSLIEGIMQQEAPMVAEDMAMAMYARYTSPDATGRVADSIEARVTRGNNRVEAKIYVGNFRELKYLTSAVPDSQFSQTGGGDYTIRARRQFLQFNWRRVGRRVSIRSVQHPGMGPDVLRQSAQTGLSRLGYLIEYNVRSAVATVPQTGGPTIAVSGRR